MSDGLRLALTLLTVLPVRGPASVDRRAASGAMAVAPAVGLLLGALAGAALVAVEAAATPLLAAAVAVAALAALTRGLHLDGLADLADGLGSYGDAVRARAVMKAPDVGALGLATVVLVLLVQVAALAACVEAGRGLSAVVLAALAGRAALPLACTPATPAATPGGLGATVAGTVAAPLAGALAAVAVGVGALVGATTGAPWQGALAVAAALLACRGVRRHAVRRVGGTTGDVLGALVETGSTAALLVYALAP